MKKLAKFVAPVRKAIVAAVGVVAEVLNAGLVHGTAAHVATVVISVATLAGVYAVPNKAAVTK